MTRFCPPAGSEKSDYQHFVSLMKFMKFPLLLSHDPCVPWSPLRCESCVPWMSIYHSLFLHPPYGFANLRMEGVNCCGWQFQFSRRQNYSFCIFLPAVVGCLLLFYEVHFHLHQCHPEGVGLYRPHCLAGFLSVLSATDTWDWGSLVYLLLFPISGAGIIKPQQHLYISEIPGFSSAPFAVNQCQLHTDFWGSNIKLLTCSLLS